MDYKTQYAIGQAFDHTEEARYELEEQTEQKILALARKLPQPYRNELTQIYREHIGYAKGLIRSARAWLHPLIRRQLIREGKHFRYAPLVERPRTLTPELSKCLFDYEQYLRNRVQSGTRIRHGKLIWNFLIRLAWRKRLENIRPADLRAYVKERYADGASPATIRSELGVIRAFFDWALANLGSGSVDRGWRKPTRQEPALVRAA